MKRCWILVAIISAAAIAGASDGPKVGVPQRLLELPGLQSCAFTPADAPGEPALICGRFNADAFAWEILRVPPDGEPEVIRYGRQPTVRESMLAWVGTEPGREGVWLDDMADDEPPHRLTASLEMLQPSIAADGRTVACSRLTDKRTGIYLLRPGDSKPERLAWRDERQPVWGPVGVRMLAIKTDQVWLLEAPRWQELVSERLTDRGMVHFDPTWGPRGEWIAFAAGWSAELAGIGLMRLADRKTWLPAIGVGGARSPAISPDGTKLAFVAGEGENAAVYVSDLELQ